MYRHLLTRRWLALGLVVAMLGVGCVWLGLWQLSRLDERQTGNQVTEANLAAAQVDVRELVGPKSSVATEDEWRPVTAVGVYDPAEQLLVRYQSNQGRSGVNVLVPLVAEDGAAVLVDRGFFESPGRTPAVEDVPAPPDGEVTVTGWLRRDSTAPAAATTPSDGTVRAISAEAVAPTSSHPLLSGWVQARVESPAPTAALAAPEPPDLGSGPHFFYGLQWFFFGLLAIAGYLYFAYDEAHPRRAGGGPTGKGSGHPLTGSQSSSV